MLKRRNFVCCSAWEARGRFYGAYGIGGMEKEQIQTPETKNALELTINCNPGMHLSPEFGLTYKQSSQMGFEISDKVEMCFQVIPQSDY